MSRSLRFQAEAGGVRLDRFLADRCPDLSRSRLQRLIADGHVVVDGGPAKPSAKLDAGQTIEVDVPEPEPSHLEPQPIALDIVYEDHDLLVVDKPAGMTVHPGPGQRDGTLANAVLAHCPDLQGIGGTLRPGIVHRLDKNTSGLVVVAKNDMAHAELSRQFKERRVTKAYIALVVGRLNPAAAIVDAPIGRHPKDRKRMAVVDNGRPARTEYGAMTYYQDFTLAEVRPVTGRTHQIRVHMASAGHPLAGDSTYGKAHPSLDRHFLHACRLEFGHPATGQPLELTSELPDELRTFLDAQLSP